MRFPLPTWLDPEGRARVEQIAREFRDELARCTERPGCPATLHRTTCAEIRDLIREPVR